MEVTGGPKIKFDRKTLLGKGGSANVFKGTYGNVSVAVKRINLDPSRTANEAAIEKREVENQRMLNHENVLKIYAVKEDDDFRYIALELCAGTLEDVIKITYNGPELQDDRNVLYQIADGLNYVHSQRLIHRDIKPANILISFDSIIKISDFGKSKKISTNSTCNMSGLKGSLLWMPPEFFGDEANIRIKATKMSDIFSAGLVFFVFLTRHRGGIHPFGNKNKNFETQANVINDKPVNIEALKFSNEYDIICGMIRHNPEERHSLKYVKRLLQSTKVTSDQKNGLGVGGTSEHISAELNVKKETISYMTLHNPVKSQALENIKRQSQLEQITYDRKKVLGKGGFSHIFEGKYGDKPVAVKRIMLDLHNKQSEADWREFEVQIGLYHANVLKIFAMEKDENFWYIALELCAGTLEDVIQNKYEGPELPSDRKVLYQIADGLDYVHSQRLIHRDIKPANILISLNSIIKISDFGISKEMSLNSTFSISGLKGSLLWMPPEFLGEETSIQVKGTKMSDIFSAGLVFFMFLTRHEGGIHPFGNKNNYIEVHSNALNNRPVNIKELIMTRHLMGEIIREMIQHDPIRRPSLKEVKLQLDKLSLRSVTYSLRKATFFEGGETST